MQDEFLKKGWLEGEAREDGLVEAFVVSVNGWSARQVCSSHLCGLWRLWANFGGYMVVDLGI